MTKKFYKVLSEGRKSCYGGEMTWEPGLWYEISGELVPCKNGFHLCKDEDLLDWLGEEVWEAEVEGEIIDHDNKVVVRKARITKRCNLTDRNARLFACDCAQQVAHLIPGPEAQECIDVARRYAEGNASYEELSAAREAAWEKTREAAWDPAGAVAAAREAVWSTADLVAWVAARNAAWASARATAKAEAGATAWEAAWEPTVETDWDVSWAAVRERQVKRLIDILEKPKREVE